MKDTKAGHGKALQGDDRITFGQLAAYSAGGIIPVALFNIAGQLVGLMGNISLGISAFWLGLIMIIPRLWDAFSDPIVGHLSDNTRSRFGRRRPYLLIGGIAVAVFFVVLWWIPKGETVHAWFPSEAGYRSFQLFYILFALLLFFTATTIFEIPHGALGMEMTSDPHERTRLFSGKSFVGNLFAMSTPWLFALANMEVFRGPGGNEADGMRYVSLMIAAILIPLSFWWTAKLREPGFARVAKQEKTTFWQDARIVSTNRNYIYLVLTIFILAMGFNFVNLLGSYIPIFYVFGGDKVAGAKLLGINGTIWAITGVLAVFPLNWISPRLGKRNTLIISMLLMTLAQLSKIVCYNPEHPYLVIIPTIMLSAGMLFFFTLGSSMVGDICDEDELRTGKRTEGSYYSFYWWFIKLGTAFASFVAGVLITLTLFDETQVTKVDSLQGSVRDMQVKASYWKGYTGDTAAAGTWLKNAQSQAADALKESKDYLVYLESEAVKKPDKKRVISPDIEAQRKNVLTNANEVTRQNIAALERNSEALVSALAGGVPGPLADSLIRATVPLIMQSKLTKARISSFDLLAHLSSRSDKQKKNRDHTEQLTGRVAEIKNMIYALEPGSPPDVLETSLELISAGVGPLKKQSPYTLLMMRVVEIGLPVLLCLLALVFAFRYGLTEKRTMEIKELLRERRGIMNNGGQAEGVQST
ncbi:MAG TPA: MFS transporter [Bacteroidales bacterium]|jgi:GPH family glycoside/pentoside/hexuronide:cation symporter|nr:MFS transporter [Bacteroidales bacterium]HQJ13017.1 MFS transporter [Bacteroidales bacterium]